MTLTRRQLDLRMQLAKEFADSPSEYVRHESRGGISKRARFLKNPDNVAPENEQPL